MELIIQQIVSELVSKILEQAYSGGINDIDALAASVLEECKNSASQMIEAIHAEVNITIRKDKAGRKDLGLVLKEKERPRELYTELGKLHLPRDYYYDKKGGKHVSVLDYMTGISAYERIGDTVKAKLVSLATDVSYAKSAGIVTGGEISRQTVKNQIRKLGPLEKESEGEEKREVPELHIYADEDHVSMQKPKKEKGKKNKQLPLVTVTEGIECNGTNRNRTIGKMHFVDINAKEVWKSVEGYLYKTYNLEKTDGIYIHGDGAKWIRHGLEDMANTYHVLDGYHLKKRLRDIAKKFPKKNMKKRFHSVIMKNDKKKADVILQELLFESESERQRESVKEFEVYLMGNWNEIVNRETLDVPGSCTEAQISHVLSERFSRDPLGWSEEGLDVLSKLRVYVQNGGKIKAKDFKKKPEVTYRMYAEKVLDEAVKGAFDWSIIEGTPKIMNIGSPTQIAIRGIGSLKNTLWS